MLIRSRRDFLRDTLRSVTALGALGSMAEFGEMNALAATGSNYQALVCIFLLGGLAIPPGSLLPIANGSDTYGLHPSLLEIQQLPIVLHRCGYVSGHRSSHRHGHLEPAFERGR